MFELNNGVSILPVLGASEEPSVCPDKEKDDQYTEERKSGHDNNDNAKEEVGQHDENNRSNVLCQLLSTSSDTEKSQPGRQPVETEPSTSAPRPHRDWAPKSSASARRALFARRRPDASASAFSGDSPSSNTPRVTLQRESSLPRSPSPRPPYSPAPPSSLSSSSCCVSTSTLRPVSPFQGLSPVIVQSNESDSFRPQSSLADVSVQCQGRLPPKDWPSTTKMVSDFSF